MTSRVDAPCQIWGGTYTGNGYPVIRRGHLTILARRQVFETHHGEILEGQIVMDTCGHRGCVEPTHLYAGTQSDRMRAFIATGQFDGGHLDRQPTYEERARGERIHTAKLTDEDIPFIRERARMGEKHGEIAKDYGVSRPAISYAVRGVTWTHIPDLIPKA
ncbi:hypothetical protein AB0383_48650 [Amycolatopsis sp. NPDC051373]|uniref:hypothetical protein n=1 Tax=Amycolatopsis sp. NPDC051373 TaxID=3155801 RepID=UPI003450C8B2